MKITCEEIAKLQMACAEFAADAPYTYADEFNEVLDAHSDILIGEGAYLDSVQREALVTILNILVPTLRVKIPEAE